MAKKLLKNPKPEKLETRPDGWERFKRQMEKIVPPKRAESSKRAKKKAPAKN